MSQISLTFQNYNNYYDENLTLPLVSVMIPNNVTVPINGTLITCTEYQNLDSNLEIYGLRKQYQLDFISSMNLELQIIVSFACFMPRSSQVFINIGSRGHKAKF